jgi:copper(I)-binding protein
MISKLFAGGAAAVALIATLTGCAAPVDEHAGHDHEHSSALTITDVWVKAVPELGEMPMTGAFMVIENTSGEDLYITGGTDTSGTTDKPLEAHEVVMDASGEMVMQVVDGGIRIPAGESVQLMPGGYHIMYLMMMKPIAVGDTITFTLNVSDGSTIDVSALAMTLEGGVEEYVPEGEGMDG